MAAGAAMLANTMTVAPVSTILFSVCLNIFDPLSSRISVVTHVTCEANIAVAGTKGDQPKGWLSTVERMRFCINPRKLGECPKPDDPEHVTIYNKTIYKKGGERKRGRRDEHLPDQAPGSYRGLRG